MLTTDRVQGASTLQHADRCRCSNTLEVACANISFKRRPSFAHAATSGVPPQAQAASQQRLSELRSASAQQAVHIRALLRQLRESHGAGKKGEGCHVVRCQPADHREGGRVAKLAV
jgi:hypothetical protein